MPLPTIVTIALFGLDLNFTFFRSAITGF